MPRCEFDANGKLELFARADSRYSRIFQTPEEATRELFDYVKSLKVPASKLRQTFVGAAGGLPKEFYDFYSLQGVDMTSAKGYADWRDLSPAQLEEKCQKMSVGERNDIFVMSLGDEIGLPQPDAKAGSEGFLAFLKGQGLNPDDVDPAAGGQWPQIAYCSDDQAKAAKPALYYWSRRYRYSYGIQQIKVLTDVLRKYLPNAPDRGEFLAASQWQLPQLFGRGFSVGHLLP